MDELKIKTLSLAALVLSCLSIMLITVHGQVVTIITTTTQTDTEIHYTVSDSPIILYGIILFMVAVPALMILAKSKTVSGLLMGLGIGLIWAVSSTALDILALLLLIGFAIVALFFKVRG